MHRIEAGTGIAGANQKRKEGDEASASVALPCQAIPRCGVEGVPENPFSSHMMSWRRS